MERPLFASLLHRYQLASVMCMLVPGGGIQKGKVPVALDNQFRIGICIHTTCMESRLRDMKQEPDLTLENTKAETQ